MFTAKNIFIITVNVKFALNAKKALERHSDATVTVFSSGKAGIDHLRQHPQDVALIDFRMKDMPGTDMIDHMRTLQPQIAIIAAPDHPAIHALQERYHIQQIINIPVTTRKLVNVLETALHQMREDDSPTVSHATPSPLTMNQTMTKPFEFWLEDTEDGETIVEVKVVEANETQLEPSMTFQRLAAEEPPMPGFVDGSTLRDLRQQMHQLGESKRILHTSDDQDDSLHTSDTLPNQSYDNVPADSQSIPAARILEAALDESTPIHTFTLQEFMQRVIEQGGEGIQPLPSWEAEAKRYVTEPDFLSDNLPFPQLEEAIEYTGAVTIRSDAQAIAANLSDMVTDPIEPVQRSHPAPTDQQTIEALEETHPDQMPSPAPMPPKPHTLPDLKVVSQTSQQVPFTHIDDTDPELAQLATTLTQMALELTADATVLARNHEIVAYAGKLPPDDLDELKEQLTIEWDKVKEQRKSRVLFASLPSTGEEFMISTRGTDAGFTLSLIFSGARPLHDIRRQSKRLADALSALPVPQPDMQAADLSQALPTDQPDISIARKPMSFLWLLNDPNAGFDDQTQQRIVQTLTNSLTQDGWQVGDIHAPDYVYVHGHMPAQLDPRETLHNLMQQTATIADDTQTILWDTSYLILQPGREMTVEEIQNFINFVRR